MRPVGGRLIDGNGGHGQVAAGSDGPRDPHCPPGLRLFEAAVQTVREARLANQERLRSLVSSAGGQVEVFSAHDPVELRRYCASSAAGSGGSAPGTAAG